MQRAFPDRPQPVVPDAAARRRGGLTGLSVGVPFFGLVLLVELLFRAAWFYSASAGLALVVVAVVSAGRVRSPERAPSPPGSAG